MIKVDIVNEVSKIADITKVKAEVAVDAVFDAMRTSMQRGERIELRGFGVFQVKPRKRGIGRNPRTGKEGQFPRPDHPLQARQRPAKHRVNAGTAGVFLDAPPKFQDRRWLHALLLLLTIASTTYVGAENYAAFMTDFTSGVMPNLALVPLLIHGIWYSGTILAILGCHELGHYFACRYYDVDASLPFFLPAPIFLTGTLGAFIRIREPIPTKRMLFDIGIAGPLAGFAVAVPALFLGLAMSHIAVVPTDFSGLELGEPLLFKLATRVVWGAVPDGSSLNMHPMAFAAWFGMLATALNLFPIGQLDGGHISYAVLGRKSSYVTLAMIAVALTLTFFSLSWLVWTCMTIGMLIFFGRHHPRVFDEDTPLDRNRMILAVVALAIFILCFTPVPVDVITGR